MNTTVFNTADLAETTREQYIRGGLKINSFLGKTKLTNVKGVEKLLVKNIPIKSTRHNYYTILSKYFRLIDREDIAKKYNVGLWKINKEILEEPKVLSDKIKNVKYQDGIDEFIEHIKENEYKTTLGELILSFYLLQPPRRLKDYQNITYIENRKHIKKGENYLLGKRQGKYEYFLIFDNYKNVKKMGTQKLSVIDKDLIKIIKNYKLKVNERIYDKSPKSFRTLLQKTSKTFFDVSLNVNDIRILHSTYKVTIKNLKEDSRRMAHSVNMKLNNYIRD